MNPQRIIEETLLLKKPRQDKFGRDYLILEVENSAGIFVFTSKVSKDKWDQLQEGAKYEFRVEEGQNGSNLLVEFTRLDEGIFA